MNGDNPISWLMFFTLISGLVVITGAFLYFLRSQRNRDIAADALAGDNSRVGATPNGAGLELAGVGVFALIVMGLLATGYAQKSSFETAQRPGPVGGAGMTQTVGQADQPKQYQPANPAPDLRVAPAGSTAGAGPDSGGRPENAPK
ncbi:MAG: hypothetical protein ABWY82_23440 [Tardiphaga sp.]